MPLDTLNNNLLKSFLNKNVIVLDILIDFLMKMTINIVLTSRINKKILEINFLKLKMILEIFLQ